MKIDKDIARDAIDSVGGQAWLASRIGVSRQLLWTWIQKGEIKDYRIQEIEEKTNRLLTKEMLLGQPNMI